MNIGSDNGLGGILSRSAGRITFLVAVALSSACATPQVAPLEASREPIEIERFMGAWYVIGSIPITFPGFSEEGAHNGVESYELTDDGTILTTYTFRKGAFDGPEKRFTPKGRVYDTDTNTEWRMQFVWPFEASYLIAWVDDDYQQTIVGVPDRKHVWLMSRVPNIPDPQYERLLERSAALGYDVDLIQRVPQRWD